MWIQSFEGEIIGKPIGNLECGSTQPSLFDLIFLGEKKLKTVSVSSSLVSSCHFDRLCYVNGGHYLMKKCNVGNQQKCVLNVTQSECQYVFKYLEWVALQVICIWVKCIRIVRELLVWWSIGYSIGGMHIAHLHSIKALQAIS